MMNNSLIRFVVVVVATATTTTMVVEVVDAQSLSVATDPTAYTYVMGQENDASSPFSVVAGGKENYIEPNSAFATIKGGTQNSCSGTEGVIAGMDNAILEEKKSSSVVSGGIGNDIRESRGLNTIAGGTVNSVNNFFVEKQQNQEQVLGRIRSKMNTINGGAFGQINAGSHNTIVGGEFTRIAREDGSTNRSTVGGGEGNNAARSYSTVPGGKNNRALKNASTAMGKGAINNGKNSFFINLVDNDGGDDEENKTVEIDEAFTVNAKKIVFKVGRRNIVFDDKGIDNLNAFLNPNGSPSVFS